MTLKTCITIDGHYTATKLSLTVDFGKAESTVSYLLTTHLVNYTSTTSQLPPILTFNSRIGRFFFFCKSQIVLKNVVSQFAADQFTDFNWLW